MGNTFDVNWMCGDTVIQQVYAGNCFEAALTAYIKARGNKPEGAYFLEIIDRT